MSRAVVPVTRPNQSAARDTIRPEGSPRSSFVHLVVLSTDASLLTTTQTAAEGELLFVPVETAESSVEHLVAGRCGILLIDLPCLRGDVHLLLTRLHAQFPGVVLMAAGRREDEAAAASLLTSGIVYRYAHKPLSPGRARQFIAASVRRYHELNEREQFGLATVREMARVQIWQGLFQHSVRIVGGAAALVSAALIALAVRHALQSDEPVAPPSAVSTALSTAKPQVAAPSEEGRPVVIAPAARVDILLREAHRMVEVGRLNDATQTVRAAAALAPDDVRVAIVATTIGQQLLTRTNVAISENNFDAAARRLEATTSLDREFNLALPDLAATRHAFEQARESSLQREIEEMLEVARVRREAGDLLTPDGASAFDQLQVAMTRAPRDTAVQAEAQALAFALLQAAERAYATEQFIAAEAFLDRTEELVPAMTAARELRQQLASRLRQPISSQ
jgi:hypothetical protein